VQRVSQRQGGAEAEMSMLFADIRGSTTLAEGMSPTEFRQVIDRFYKATTAVLIRSEALIDKLVGDEVVAYFIQGLAGPEHARKAIEAAIEILKVTGHDDPNGPWVPVGAGVHTGIAFFGTVGSNDGVTDVTALGDAVNASARLASVAATGELLVSEAALTAAQWNFHGLEEHDLELKGRSESLKVRVIRLPE
jgi:adenylate cyclase